MHPSPTIQCKISFNEEIMRRMYSTLHLLSKVSILGDATIEGRYTQIGGLDKIALDWNWLYGDLAIGGSANIYTGSTESAFYGEFVDVQAGANQAQDSIRFHRVRNVTDKQHYRDSISPALCSTTRQIPGRRGFKTPFEIVTKHDIKRATPSYIRSVSPIRRTCRRSNTPSLYLGKIRWKFLLDITFGICLSGDSQSPSGRDIEYANL